jgi:alpha-glucosidase
MITRRAYQVQLPGDWPPESVTVNGAHLAFMGQQSDKIGWRYEGNTLMTIVTTPRASVRASVRIEVRRPVGSLASRSRLDGFAGSIERLREAYDTLNALSPLTWSPNSLTDAWQTGDRLTYHPETARDEIARFPQRYSEGVAAVNDLMKSTPSLTRRMVSNGLSERSERYQPYLHRAAVLLEDGKPQSSQ